MKKSVLILCSSLCFTGCTHETIGQIGGGAAGALIGSQVGGGSGRMVATAIGALVGSQLGGYFGKKISKAEEDRIAQATNVAIKNNQVVSWSGENHDFKVKPIGQDHNEKKVSILMKEKGGKFKEVIMHAKKNNDGTYSLIEKV